MRHREPEGEAWLGIHELFPGEGEGSWTEDAVPVTGESLDDLRQTLLWMMEALDEPIMDADVVAAQRA